MAFLPLKKWKHNVNTAGIMAVHSLSKVSLFQYLQSSVGLGKILTF